MKWISVKDEFPESYARDYLCSDGEDVFTAAFSPQQRWYDEYGIFDGVTHWMSLPEPPQEYTP